MYMRNKKNRVAYILSVILHFKKDRVPDKSETRQQNFQKKIGLFKNKDYICSRKRIILIKETLNEIVNRRY
jgi:hypothetical protein